MKKPVILSGINDARLPKLLKDGCVGVMPTDTQYGLVAAAGQANAVERLYTLKGRENRPGTLLAANTEQLMALGLSWGDVEAAARFWPGPVSVVMPADSKLEHLHLGMNSLAVRIPASDALCQLLSSTGILQTSSANPTGEQPAATMQQAQDYFGDSVDFYVAGTDASTAEPSTVIRIYDGSVEVLRKGAGQLPR